MKLLLIEPYGSTSHLQWANLLLHNLKHEVAFLHLPGRHWKWRMHQAPLHFAAEFKQLDFLPDLIITSEMMDLALFKSLIKVDVPVVLYFHENQLTYPISAADTDLTEGRDNHYGFLNLTSALVADAVLFNSHFHHRSFLESLPDFLAQFPDKIDPRFIEDLSAKCAVMVPGIDAAELDRSEKDHDHEFPLILWNHRWEYDKNPDLFFDVLFELADQCPFQLVLIGGDQRKAPSIFEEAKKRMGRRIVQYGYVKDRANYLAWLWKCDLIVSTSNQDFFGISVVEAIYCKCLPLLPNRLAFPEHIPQDLQTHFLYDSETDLREKLRYWLSHWREKNRFTKALRTHLQSYEIRHLAKQYDDLFDQILAQTESG